MFVGELIQKLQEQPEDAIVIFNVPAASSYPWELDKAAITLGWFQPDDGWWLTKEKVEEYQQPTDVCRKAVCIELDL